MRLFIATSFPAEVIRDLNERVARVRPRLPAASWVREESQHATFAFLGEHPESLIARIEPALNSDLAAIPRFEAHLEGSGFFPNARHARVGWIGLTPQAHFVRVAEAVRNVVTQNGVVLDGGEFRPHLTLMRMRDPWPPASIELFGKALGDFRSPAFVLDSVTLYSSELHPKGAIHTPVKKFPLS